jgi:hypothetical protein
MYRFALSTPVIRNEAVNVPVRAGTHGQCTATDGQSAARPQVNDSRSNTRTRSEPLQGGGNTRAALTLQMSR